MIVRAMIVALAICYACPLAIGQERSYQSKVDELMSIADRVFERSNAVLAAETRKELQNRVNHGVEKVKSEQQMNEARVAMGRLAQAMVDRCPHANCPEPRAKIVLLLGDLERALVKVCPLYPFC